MVLDFDWDQWNIQKNEIKHGVARLEAESTFFDNELLIYNDLKHSTKKEKRYICFGLSIRNRILMIAFTIRSKKIRVISARPASKKERKIYEEQKNKRD
ncbi:BrnT family toxin [Caminibacter pacificus]